MLPRDVLGGLREHDDSQGHTTGAVLRGQLGRESITVAAPIAIAWSEDGRATLTLAVLGRSLWTKLAFVASRLANRAHVRRFQSRHHGGHEATFVCRVAVVDVDRHYIHRVHKTGIR
jgi:hypothetical protein